MGVAVISSLEEAHTKEEKNHPGKSVLCFGTGWLDEQRDFIGNWMRPSGLSG